MLYQTSNTQYKKINTNISHFILYFKIETTTNKVGNNIKLQNKSQQYI